MKKSTRIKGTRLQVKAVIRYNKQDAQTVVYFRQGKRFFKMLDGKRIRPLGRGYTCFANLSCHWSQNVSVTVVDTDEEVNYKGMPVDIHMDAFTLNRNHVSLA